MAGKGLGRSPAVAAVMLFACLAVVFPMISAATSHTVGDSTGWTIPPNASFYQNWAASQKFTVGDTLVFNFPTGGHTVVEVPKSSFDACSTSNQVGPTQSNGPATVTISSAGTHYYICSVTGHCSANQKLSVTTSGTGGSPAPSTPDTTPVSGDSPGGPTPSPTAGGPPGTSSPGGSSAAPPASTVGIAAAAAAGLFLAVVALC